MRTPTLVMALGLGLAGCSVEVPLPTMQADLIQALKDPVVLTAMCRRPINEGQANSAGPALKITSLVAKRPFFGKEGKATMKVSYAAPAGAPCTGTATFDFRDVGTASRLGKRGVHYTSAFELSNFVMSPGG
jgi:hypothetical protein